MYGDEQAFLRWLDTLASRYGRERVDDLHAELVTLMSRMERRHQQDMTDMQAAKLLTQGVDAVVESQGCHRSTVYRRVSRAQKVARQILTATGS